jgi:TM2 domain-containing membrane protein YozV
LNLHLPNLPALPTAFWLAVTALSLAGAALLVFSTAKVVVGFFVNGQFDRANDAGHVQTFFLLCASAYLVPFVLTGFFDRYLLPVTAFLTAFLALSFGATEFGLSRAGRALALLLIIGFGVFAIAGTRDYLEWNRTRWRAVDGLLAKMDVKPKDIDGGFEFNGWYMYDTFTMTNWWVVKGTYVVSFGKIEGYEPISRYTYKHWMLPYEGTIFVLKSTTQE